jgi:hypothetical protein
MVKERIDYIDNKEGSKAMKGAKEPTRETTKKGKKNADVEKHKLELSLSLFRTVRHNGECR